MLAIAKCQALRLIDSGHCADCGACWEKTPHADWSFGLQGEFLDCRWQFRCMACFACTAAPSCYMHRRLRIVLTNKLNFVQANLIIARGTTADVVRRWLYFDFLAVFCVCFKRFCKRFFYNLLSDYDVKQIFGSLRCFMLRAKYCQLARCDLRCLNADITCCYGRYANCQQGFDIYMHNILDHLSLLAKTILGTL